MDECRVRHDVAISADSERIAYTAAGRGEPALIFIHGWNCDSRYWREQHPLFSKNHRVVALDLAGHGHSSLDRAAYTMSAYSEDVKAVVEKEKIGRAILIGHSMGGAVIAEAARLMPVRVVGIIGIDTLQNVAGKISQKNIDESAGPLKKDFRTGAKGFARSLFRPGTDEALVRWVEEDMSSAPGEIAMKAFQGYLGQFVTGEAARVLEDLTVPVVSINARLWPTDAEENRKHIKNYKLYYIEETGHFPMLEEPEAFNALLREAIKYIGDGEQERDA
jgi:pimeloyl-ACP methyl ester carboxylesterase